MIYTSYFGKYRGTNGVSVSQGNPIAGMNRCPELMPLWSNVKAYKDGEITWKEFRRAYIRMLKKMDVHEWYNKLDGKVLLCFEKTGKKCHRNIIREWFIRNGYECEELETSEEPRMMYNCLFCKKIHNEEIPMEYVCTVTGEVLSSPGKKVCSDWRYRF